MAQETGELRTGKIQKGKAREIEWGKDRKVKTYQVRKQL